MAFSARLTDTGLGTRADIDALEVTTATHTTELAQIQKYKYGFDEYGMFVKPADFTPTLPCNFWRDSNGDIQDDMDFTQYTGGTQIYVDLVSGNDSTGNGSVGTPYKTLKKAMDIVVAASAGSYCIRVVSTAPFMRAESWTETGGYVTLADKTVAIIPDNPANRIILSSAQRSLVWTADGAGTWKATRSLVGAVYDLRNVDSRGVYVQYDSKASVAECQATASSWYSDNVTVWVHPTDGLVPVDGTILCNLKINVMYVNLTGTSKLYLQNVDALRTLANDSTITTTGTVTATTDFIANNCRAIGGYTTDNGYTIYGHLNVYFFDCDASYSNNDGINIHVSNVDAGNRRDCLAVLCRCTGSDNGVLNVSTNSNVFTAHGGMNVLAIGCEGQRSKGPVLAFVNGCYGICVDCDVHDSLLTSGATKASYYFDNVTPPSGVVGKALLINCDSVGTDLTDYSLATDAGYDVRLYSFIGSNFGSTTTPKIIG